MTLLRKLTGVSQCNRANLLQQRPSKWTMAMAREPDVHQQWIFRLL